MTCYSTTAFLAVLTLTNFFFGRRRMLYPPLIYSSVWCIDTAIFGLGVIDVHKVHAITWGVITVGALAFSLGGWLASLVPATAFKIRFKTFSHPTVSAFGRRLLVALCVLGVPLLLHDVLQRGAGGPGGVLANARLAYIDMADAGKPHGFLIGNLPVFSIWVAIICLIEEIDTIFWVALASSVVCCVLTTGRTFVLMLFSAIVAAHMLKTGRNNVAAFARFALLPVLSFVALFVGLTFLNKDLSGYDGNIAAILANFILAYLVVPIPAFDYVLTHASEYTHSVHHSFAFLFKALSWLGFSVTMPPVNDSYVFVPLPTNVYTVYKFFLTDFGLLLLFVVVISIGLLQTMVYRRALAGGRVSLVISSLLVYPTLLSIFDDAYSGSGLLLLMKATGLAVLYFGFLNRLGLRCRVPRLHLGLRYEAKGDI